MTRAAIMVALAAFLGACATSDSGPPLLPGRVNAPPPTLGAGDDSLLTYALWVWQDSQLSGGTRMAPDAVGRYTLEFLPDGTVDVRADCNRGRGPYKQNGAQLSVGPIAMTKMACATGSRDTEFLKQLSAVGEQSLRGTDLVLTLRANGGSMRFATPRP